MRIQKSFRSIDMKFMLIALPGYIRNVVNTVWQPGKKAGLPVRAVQMCFFTAMLLTGCSSDDQNTATQPPPPPPPPPPPVVIAKPIGAFSASGVQDDAVLSHLLVQGTLIRMPWDAVESSAGVYDYTMLDNNVALVKAAGKKWSLAVIAGGDTPEWIYAEPYYAPRIDYLFRGAARVMAPAWDASVRERLQLLAQSLAEKFGDDPDLEVIYVTQMTANGIEGQLPQDSQLLPSGTTWATDYGWTDALWVDAVTGITRDFAAAFSEKAIAVELHDVLGDATIPQRIGDNLCGDATLDGRVGIAIWWLSGSTTYQSELLDYFRDFSCDKYGQVIAPSSDTQQFPNGYEGVFTQAKELNLRYVEFWQDEFTGTGCCIWEDEIADFNTWATSTFPE